MRKHLNLKKFFTVCCILALIGLVYFEVTVFAPSRLHAKDYTISDASIPEDFNDLKIAVISDVYGDVDKLNQAVEILNMRNPDVVVFLGNLLDQNDETTIDEIVASLTKIRAPLGKYAIMGSTDSNYYETVIKSLERSDFRLVQNRIVNLHNFTDTSIQLLFLDETNTEQTMEDVLETLDDSVFTMTFLNNPANVERISGKNIHITVGGETLGGKVNLPFLGSVIFKDAYTQSDVRVGNTRLLLSHGIATPTPKVRLFADPNLLFITLRTSD